MIDNEFASIYPRVVAQNIFEVTQPIYFIISKRFLIVDGCDDVLK